MDDNKQKKLLGERIEDTLDEGSIKRRTPSTARKNGSDDVPYIMEAPSGFRRINKFVAGHNLALGLVKKPWLILPLSASSLPSCFRSEL